MKTPLSPRLLACCDFIRPGDVVADVGCDHGYLGIHLLQRQTAARVMASDIHSAPLDCARKNALKYGVLDRMSFYLSDGAKAIPRDFTVMVCAGMGGNTMISILESAPWLKDPKYRLILQCQSRTALLRKYLSDEGYCIRDEIPVKDGKFIYTVMEIVYAPGTALSPGQCYLSPALTRHRGQLLDGYQDRILGGLRLAVENQGDAVSPFVRSAYLELAKEFRDGTC